MSQFNFENYLGGVLLIKTNSESHCTHNQLFSCEKKKLPTKLCRN